MAQTPCCKGQTAAVHDDSPAESLLQSWNSGYWCAGIGKSTLLGLISGQLEPTRGTITRNPKVRMAVFSQHHVDGLDLALTPLAYMLASFANTQEQEHRCQPRCHTLLLSM